MVQFINVLIFGKMMIDWQLAVVDGGAFPIFCLFLFVRRCVQFTDLPPDPIDPIIHVLFSFLSHIKWQKKYFFNNNYNFISILFKCNVLYLFILYIKNQRFVCSILVASTEIHCSSQLLFSSSPLL